MSNTEHPAVKIRNLSFAYQKRLILNKISLEVKQGQYMGIIGPNGGGKTTLLRLLLGFLEPLDGEISLAGLAPKKAGTKIGYVPQALQYDSSFPISTLELVLAGRLAHLPWWGRYSTKDREKAKEGLEKVGLSKQITAPFSKLSGGQRQRALIARAIVNNPDLLILDEPTANLDTESRVEIYDLLDKLKGKTTILMVTHDLRTVVDRVDSVICVEQTANVIDPHQICEHFALGLYHHPLIHSGCNPPSDKQDNNA